jgi:hypothetical protein
VKDCSENPFLSWSDSGRIKKIVAQSLTRRSKTQARHAQNTQNTQNLLDLQPRNLLKFNQEGSAVKNLDGLQKFINFAL